MIALWHFYWPVFSAGLVIGLAAGWLSFYRRPHVNKGRALTGAALAVAGAALWHGPLGTGERMASGIETAARTELDRLELPFIAARLDRRPLRRRLLLSGPADDFQRRELPAYMLELPGVASVRWVSRTRMEAQ